MQQKQTQWKNTHKTQKFRQKPEKNPHVGKPNERERDLIIQLQ
jgi:hypothetical protein